MTTIRALIRTGRRAIHVMNADGSDVVRLTSDDADAWDAAWSPDGRRIAFVSERDGNADIYTIDADGSNPVRLTDHPGRDVEPAWSPDGMSIAFSSDRTGVDYLYVVGVENRLTTLLPGRGGRSPVWTDDGRRLAFVRWGGAYGQTLVIYRMDPTGGNERLVGEGDQPAWSPDGRMFAVAASTCHYWDWGPCTPIGIHVLDERGAVQRTLTAGTHTSPAWRR